MDIKKDGRTIFDNFDPEITEGGRIWRTNHVLHRYPGPAIEYNNGRKEWWVEGVLHRLDGPAVEDGSRKLWYANGINITYEVEKWILENNISLPMNDEAKLIFKMRWG